MDDATLNSLALRLLELRQEKRYLEGEIDTVSQQLAEGLGQGTKRDFDNVSVRVSVAKPGLRIVRAAEVPAEFRSLQPDRKLLLQHVATTGTAPAGVAITEGKPIVYTRAPGDGAGADADDEG
ncbi:MAG: hypothetical protein JNL28_03930 [Planctomycetes bacterium]|nr:hypothetical protein [Planctomycetota bacterium]